MSEPSSHEPVVDIGRVLAGVVLVGLLLVLISWASPVLNPVLVAFFLAALAAPLYFWLQKHGVSTTISLILLITVLVLAIAFIAGLLLISSNVVAEELAQHDLAFTINNTAVETTLGRLGLTQQGLDDAVTSARMSEVVLTFVAAAADLAANLLFALVLVAFMLAESPRLISLTHTHLSDRPIFSQMPAIGRSVITYFGVRTRLNLITGLGFGLLLLILGVDHALLWAILAFVLSYIPYIGLVIAMIPPAILALSEGGIAVAAAVLIGAVAINLTIENIIEPRLTGKVMKLSPVVVLISFFFWAWLLGPVGALLSMPITVTIMLVTRQDPRTQWIARIIGSEEPPAAQMESIKT